jgi:Putative endonuclease segE, GIY-YIG domain
MNTTVPIMTNEWIYQGNPITEIEESVIGFIYIITQISTGKKYIGKKKSFFKKTSYKVVKLKNGTKKRKKIRSLVPSDWATYFGSSDALKAEIEKCGVDDFTREIVIFCKSESELTYQESKLQFSTDCLLKPDEYWNSWIMCRVRRDHLIKPL